MRERDEDGAGEKEEDESGWSPGKMDSALFCERLAGSRQVFCVVSVCMRVCVKGRSNEGFIVIGRINGGNDDNNASEGRRKASCCGLCLCSMH